MPLAPTFFCAEDQQPQLRQRGGWVTPIATARLVRCARPLERRGGHLRMRRIRRRDCVPRTGREPQATSWLSGLNPGVVCTLPWHCYSVAGGPADAKDVMSRLA